MVPLRKKALREGETEGLGAVGVLGAHISASAPQLQPQQGYTVNSLHTGPAGPPQTLAPTALSLTRPEGKLVPP